MTIIRRLIPFLIATLLTSAGNPPTLVQVDDTRVMTSVEYEYGAEIRFIAEIETTAPILRATVFFKSPGSPDTNSILADHTPGFPTLVVAIYDLRISPLVPFTPIIYWWQVDLEDGSSETTVATRFVYIDNRFIWQSLSAPPISIHWVDCNFTTGQSMLGIAVRSLDSIDRDLALPVPPELNIYIYPSKEHLQAGLKLGGQSFSGGHTELNLDAVIISMNDGPEAQLDLERDIARELTRFLLNKRVGDGFEDIPAWLTESLIVSQEFTHNIEYRLSLERAFLNDMLLSIESLCSSLPFSDANALLAYGQSVSFVQYLKDIYGAETIASLLDAYQEGTTCTEGVQRVFRRSIDQLEAEWIRATFDPTSPLLILRPLLPWALLTLPIFALILVAFLPTKDDAKSPKESGK